MCRKLLKLPNCPEVRLPVYGFAGSYELTLLAVCFTMILALWLHTVDMVYSIIGVALPVFFCRVGVPITNYW